MAFDIIYKEDGGVITTYSGMVTDSNLIESAIERMGSEERVKSYNYFLSDFSKVDEFDISSDGLRQVSLVVEGAAHAHEGLIAAVVLPTDLEYGMGRMFQAFCEKSSWNIFITRDRKEAEEWLNDRLNS